MFIVYGPIKLVPMNAKIKGEIFEGLLVAAGSRDMQFVMKISTSIFPIPDDKNCQTSLEVSGQKFHLDIFWCKLSR